jgi:TfoX N-terminal domain
MNTRYLDDLKVLLERVLPELGTTRVLSFKNVFGAVGGYIDNTIFVTCGTFGVALRLPPAALKGVFAEEGVHQLRYFPKGHIKKEYAVLPPRILEDSEYFRRLVDLSIDFVGGLEALQPPRS